MYKELIEYIVKSLVENKDEVQITETKEDEKANYEIAAAKSDMGRIIGKDGRIIKAIREIATSYAGKNNERISISIKEIK